MKKYRRFEDGAVSANPTFDVISFTGGAVLSTACMLGIYMLSKAAKGHEEHKNKVAIQAANITRLAEDSVKHFINIVNKSEVKLEKAGDVRAYAERSVKKLQNNYSCYGKAFLEQFFRFEAILIYCCRNKCFFIICGRKSDSSPYVSPVELWDWMDEWLFREKFVKGRNKSPLFLAEMPEQSIKETEKATEELRNLNSALEVLLFEGKAGNTKDMFDSCIHVPVLRDFRSYGPDYSEVIDKLEDVDDNFIYDYAVQKHMRITYEEIYKAVSEENGKPKQSIIDAIDENFMYIMEKHVAADELIKIMEIIKNDFINGKIVHV